MAREDTTSQDLYDLLVTQNLDPEITDERGQPAQPDSGRVFTFDWTSETGTNYGTAVVLITDDGELQLFFGDNLGRGMEEPDKTEWYDFMQQLSRFAARNNFLTFSPKNLNRLKHAMAGMAAIREGLFEGYYGTRKVSYMGEQRQARLMIRHKRDLAETDRRHLNVESLFIETVEGERFKLPFRDLRGGKAMLTHVREGGRPYDVRGVHIAEMVEELKVLSRFNRASAGRVVEGVTQELVEQAREYYGNLRESMRRMGGHRGYTTYFETWTPLTETDSESLVEDIKTLFTEQTLDTRIEAALPVLAKIKETNMREADIFESYINRLAEGTWAVPDTPEAERKLQELMTTELPVGPDATNATEQIYDLIGDDELFDQLELLARDDPDADARPLIQDRLEELGYYIGQAADDEEDQNMGQDLQETTKHHHFIYEVAYDPRYQYTHHPGDPRTPSGETQAAWEKVQAQQKKEKQERQKQQSAGSAGKDDFVAPHGDVKQELELFAAGRKPAAIVNEPHFGLWKRLIDSGRYVLQPLTGEGGRQSGLVIGQPGEDGRVSKIRDLVQNATDAGLKGNFRAYQNSNYHRWLGRLLGYPAEAIERFIANYFRDTEDLAKQRFDEQNTASGRRMPKVGDTIEWSTMRDRTPQRGRVIDVDKLFMVTVHPENSQQPIKLSLANKSLTFRVIPNPALDTPPPPPPAKPAAGSGMSGMFKDIRNAEGESRREFGNKILAAGGQLKYRSRGPFGPDAYVLNGKEVRWEGVQKPVGTLSYVPPSGSTQTSAPAAAMSEADNLSTFEGSGCNHTMEGESCPVHGLRECGMYEGDDRADYNRTADELNKARQKNDLDRVKELSGQLLKRAGPQGFEIDIQGNARPLKESDELARLKNIVSSKTQ